MKLTQKLFALSCLTWATVVFSATIQSISIEGLSHIKLEAVLEKLSIHSGMSFSQVNTDKLIEEVYKTDLFESVSVYRQGEKLIIRVKERPFIRSITMSGNEIIEKDKLQENVTHAGLVEGHVFNEGKLALISASLKQAYDNLGRYNAVIITEVKPVGENQVDITLSIKEGPPARIKDINLLGNTVYSRSQLLSLFSLKPSNLWTFSSRSDRYVKEKLDGDLETLRSYYLDRGYLKFLIRSTTVSMSPDKKGIYITIQVEEGDRYTIQEAKLFFTDNTPVDQQKLYPLLDSIHPGEIFSRKELFKVRSALVKELSDQGYAFAQIDLEPVLDEVNHTVKVNYKITPGKMVTVHRINFTGNTVTNTEVLRREMRQLEGTRFNLNEVEESKRRLSNLSYLKDIRFVIDPVPGHAEQVDLNFHVDEQSAAYFTAEATYSAFYHFIYNFSVTQNNFMGTGKSVQVSFNRSDSSTAYTFHYHNPYATVDGISHSFNFYRRSYMSAKLDLTPYTRDMTGFSDGYGFPIEEHLHFSVGYGFEKSELKIGSIVPQQVIQFVDTYGRRFDQIKLNTGLHYNTFDRAIFPTDGLDSGFNLDFKLPVGERSLGYYLAGYELNYYHPLPRAFVLNTRGSFAIGEGYGKTKELPFYEHFYAGGIDSVGGYQENSLGPKDSFGNPYGGNAQILGSADLIFPAVFGDNVRTAAFLNVGNVFEGKIKWNDLRYSSGVSLTWISPLGPLKFILAKPINPPDNSFTRTFDFTIGVGV